MSKELLQKAVSFIGNGIDDEQQRYIAASFAAGFHKSMMPRWIPVSDPPKESGWYRTNGNGDGCPCSRYYMSANLWHNEFGDTVYPSHWQHITPEPKGGTE